MAAFSGGAANISNVCLLCCANVGKQGQSFRGRRCFNTSNTLQEVMRKTDPEFFDKVLTLSHVRALYVCTACTNKLNKLDIRLKQLERSQAQLEQEKEKVQELMSRFKRNYLPASPRSGVSFTDVGTNRPSSQSRALQPSLTATCRPTSTISTTQHTQILHTPRHSSKIPRSVGFSPFTKGSEPSPAHQVHIHHGQGVDVSPSRIPVRRKIPKSSQVAKPLLDKENRAAHTAAKQLFEDVLKPADVDDPMAGLGLLEDLLAVHQVTEPLGSASRLQHTGGRSTKEFNSVAKVMVRFGKQEKTRYIAESEEESVAICRGIVRGGKEGTTQVANAVYRNTEIRDLLEEKILRELDSQCTDLCSTVRHSLLRDTSPQHLNKFELLKILEEWHQRGSLLYIILMRILHIHCPSGRPAELHRKEMMHMVAIGSTLLFNRCQQLSAFQHAVGLLLDFGGARNKTITSLSNCGISVSTQTIYKQRKAIEKYHDACIKDRISNQKEKIVFAAISSVPCLTLPIYSTNSSSLNIIKHLLGLGVFKKDPSKIPSFVNWDIYGDNLDYSSKPFHQTLTKRTEDIHWFLPVGAPLRVVPPDSLDQTRPRRDIRDIPNTEFMPSSREHQELRDNFIFHVLEVVTQYVTYLKQFRDIVPKYIPHPPMNEMAKKTDYDVLEKNENINTDVIDILNHIHEEYVMFVPEALGENVIERMVFGGDLLTNERAYSAQLNMANGINSASRLMGILHRTEGLHLCMNTCLYILEIFYSSTSVRDIGTLYNLKTLVDRRNITLDMTNGCNQAKNLIDDVLDSHIVACCLDYLGMNHLDEKPTKNNFLLGIDATDRDVALSSLTKMVTDIVDMYVLHGQPLTLSENLRNVDEDGEKQQKKTGKFCCSVTNCRKSYSFAGGLKRHMKEKHGIVAEGVRVAVRMEADERYDGVNNYAASFMNVALLFQDIRDAYKIGDGNRLFRNFKFLLLYFTQSTHVKYRLWVWRMLAYDLGLLSEYERYAYRWNMSVNVVGGIRSCIANDNLVEIHVHKVKEMMRAQGANVSYEAVRRACKCLGTVQSLLDVMGSFVSGGHADYTEHKIEDVTKMSSALLNNGSIKYQATREHANFPNFPNDLLSSVDLVKFNGWLHNQKIRAAREMQS